MTHFAASLDGQERGGKLLSNEGNPWTLVDCAEWTTESARPNKSAK